MKPRRRPPITSTAPPATQVVRLGFTREAKAAFAALSQKERDGLRRKLKEFGANPAIGKPLVGDLQGYHRVTYGRLRSIAERRVVVMRSQGVVIVHYIGLRKEGAKDDPYERAAAEAIHRRDPEALEALEALIQQALASQLSDDDE